MNNVIGFGKNTINAKKLYNESPGGHTIPAVQQRFIPKFALRSVKEGEQLSYEDDKESDGGPSCLHAPSHGMRREKEQ